MLQFYSCNSFKLRPNQGNPSAISWKYVSETSRVISIGVEKTFPGEIVDGGEKKRRENPPSTKAAKIKRNGGERTFGRSDIDKSDILGSKVQM